MALRTGSYTPEESATAQRMRNARDTYKVIGRALNRSEKSVQNHLNAILFTPVHAMREPAAERVLSDREDEMLRQVRADGGFPRAEMIAGQTVWVRPFHQADA